MSGDQQTRRAVSPVIGVILMVAITVILAAVIGAFVLEIGDQQETAPSTSLETEERVSVFMGKGPSAGDSNCGNQGCETNLTEVAVTHAGGDVLDIDQFDVKVDGNSSVFGDPQNAEEYTGSTDPTIVPQPNTLETRGTNREISFSSGDTLEIIGHNGLNQENIDVDILGSSRRLEWALRDDGDYYCRESDTGPVEGHTLSTPAGIHNPTIYVFWGDTDSGYCVDDLDAGNDVSIVWSAESGGKTQTLLSYTVQQSNANQ